MVLTFTGWGSRAGCGFLGKGESYVTGTVWGGSRTEGHAPAESVSGFSVLEVTDGLCGFAGVKLE